MGKVILLDKNVKPYRKIADSFAENENFLRALEFLLSAKNISFNLDVIVDIADLYADMGLLELSNKYWYIYLDKAPKDKVSVAYEELAINYFYMDNYLASSFYFHQKLSVDGFINKEGLGQEILDFFSGEELKRSAYRVVYPFDKADFSFDKKRAKRAISVGAFSEAVKILKDIPEECRDEETSGDLAVSLFMSDELDEAEKVCRYSLLAHGENVTAYCNLSTVFDMKEDLDNSEFYYRKALSVRKGDKGEVYKIATCSIEREDHITANECLKKIVEERPYELLMRFFLGLSFANLGDFFGAEEQLKYAYKLNPDDVVIKEFLKIITAMNESGNDSENLLPFKYVKELPESKEKKWKKKIRDTAKNSEKMSSMVKKSEFKDMIVWGLFNNDSAVMRDSAFILSTVYSPYCKRVILDALLNPDGGEELKRLLVYILILKGEKEKFGLVAGSFYLKFKPKKLVCEKKPDGGIYLSSYALCVSRIIFNDVEDLDKLAYSCDRVYKSLSDKLSPDELTNEELGALILSEGKLKRLSDDNAVMRFFDVKKDKFDKLKQLLKGEKDD
ncbi:MAG: hypothetical protein E7373_01425 [Clostridiales bacterium]|nr:hypothetical protein [Clostridiales bacterium]